MLHKRGFHRFRINAEVTIKTKDNIFTGTMEDMSMQGLYLSTHEEIELGTEAEITIPLPSVSKGIFLTIKGIAIRIEADGVGFKFSNIDFETFTHLRAILSKKKIAEMAALH